MIPYGKQLIDDSDIAAVVEVLKSDWLTTGPKIEEFEEKLAEYCGAKYAVVVSSGTAALHIAMLAAEIRKDDWVITSANTFLSSANCVEMVGANVNFADIHPRHLCLSLDTVKSVWNHNVKAIMPVDYAGFPCVTQELAAFAHDHNALVIEDAAHAIGSERDGYKVGGIPWVDMTIFSFHPVKTITTGEGGAILTNDSGLAQRCRLFRNHGMIKDQQERIEAFSKIKNNAGDAQFSNKQNSDSDVSCAPFIPRENWSYEMHELGYNYRMTDIQAALGISQLRKIDHYIKRRQEIVDCYNEVMKNWKGISCPVSQLETIDSASARSRIAWHLYAIHVDYKLLGITRKFAMRALRECEIGTQVHYIPVYLQSYYQRKYNYQLGKCPVAESHYEHAMSLPLYPDMSDDDIGHVIKVVSEVLLTKR